MHRAMGWISDSCFFFNDTATTEIYTLSLHDALPIFDADRVQRVARGRDQLRLRPLAADEGHLRAFSLQRVGHRDGRDRKSTRLNSSHANISYAVFCLKKKNNYALSSTSSLL